MKAGDKDDYATMMIDVAKNFKWKRLVEGQMFLVGAGVMLNLTNRHGGYFRGLYGFSVESRKYVPDGEYYMIPTEMLQHLDAVADWVSHEVAYKVLTDLASRAEENK